MLPVAPRRLSGLRALAVVGLVGFGLAGCAAATPADSPSGSSGSGASAPATPTVSALTTASGSIVGGTSVTITGTDLAGVTAVSFGTTAAPITDAKAGSLTVTTPASANYVSGSVPVTVTGATGTALAYNYTVVTPIDKQMTYLMKYWSTRNSAVYGEIGDNDCVNFTSQSLIARGWKMDDSWWHNQDGGTNHYANAWASSTAMMNYFKDRPEKATALTDQQRDKVAIGDIVQFDWDNSGDRDHTGVVTRIEGTGADIKIYFAGHTTDSDFRSVDTAITTDHPGATAYYWHLLK